MSSQAKAIAIAPKFTSMLSMFGSGFIAVDVLRNKKKSTHHRLLLGMSVCDVVVSSWFFLGTWPIPSFEPVYGAVGNYPTCIAQGFFSQFSLAVAFYNANLSIYYLAVIKWGWSSEQIRVRIEPLLHAFALTIGLTTATMGIALNLYNNDHWECWISPFPLDCQESWKHGGETNCIRGDNASLYRWLFYYMFLWMAIVIVTINMVSVYRTVLLQEKANETMLQQQQQQQQEQKNNDQKNNKDNNNNDEEDEHDKKKQQREAVRRREHSKKVAIQGYWYCGAFYLTWILPTVTRLVQVMNGSAPFPLIILTAMFVPFQGFFNLLVYTMPRYTQWFGIGTNEKHHHHHHLSASQARRDIFDEHDEQYHAE